MLGDAVQSTCALSLAMIVWSAQAGAATPRGCRAKTGPRSCHAGSTHPRPRADGPGAVVHIRLVGHRPHGYRLDNGRDHNNSDREQ